MDKKLDDDAAQVQVLFRYSGDGTAETVHLAGDFNDWSLEADPMERMEDGTFQLWRRLERGRQLSYRYVIDGLRWETDPDADDFASNGMGEQNGVVFTDDVGE
jgi:1,4-alpha-glucan branching enzyme